MGVPALFRWLSQKYPKIISPVHEEQPQVVDGHEIPIDIRKPNPNGEEVDNLYLDMNNIVHPCSHPEDRPPPANEEEMMLEVFKYMERIINMARPRKLLMLAVDGVAPRAKMNQQRSRRFRSAKEAKEKDQDKAELLKMLRQQNGGEVDESVTENMNKKTWDSNAITPGTPFMNILANSLRYWISYKLSTDPAWENLKVIISDATVPGEGEHKIMEFIRSQRSSPEHDPNTRHVIYGLDADLIMLGLATHEPHFRVLREDVFFQDAKPGHCRICGQPGHKADQCKGEAKAKSGEFDEKGVVPVQKPYIWLHVSVLREYLAIEMEVPGQPFRFDLERALDDWVFMCFFVGNDFLPHLPSLDVREQGIDTLIAIWRDNIPIMGGYLTKDGHVDLDKAQLILEGLAKQEDAIFKRRRQAEQRKDANAKRRKLEDDRRNGHRVDHNAPDAISSSMPVSRWNVNQPAVPISQLGHGPQGTNGITHDMVMNRDVQTANTANKSAAAVLKERLSARAAPTSDSTESTPSAVDAVPPPESDTAPVLGKRKAENLESDGFGEDSANATTSTADGKNHDEEAGTPDTVRLWEEGYAERYYEQKFHVAPSNIAFRHSVGRAYVEGLAWVLLYYFQGCPSWTWYYPYHYAPFAADFVDIKTADLSFVKGSPSKPYEQLMGVLPAASNHNIPEVFHPLMTEEDSPIIDFYPEDFEVDLNGKKFAWQGVALLPFIDRERLLAAMNEKYPLLSPDEVKRNELGSELLVFSDRHPLYESVAANFYSKREGDSVFTLNPKISQGLAGKVVKNPDYLPQSTLEFPLEGNSLPTLEEDHSMSLEYRIPKSSNIHKSMILRGVVFEKPVLDQADIQATRGRIRGSGRSYGGAPFRREYDNRGGRQQNGHGHGHGHGNRDQIDYSSSRPNPFGQLLDPQFLAQGGFPPPPPPPMAASNGWNQAGAYVQPGTQGAYYSGNANYGNGGYNGHQGYGAHQNYGGQYGQTGYQGQGGGYGHNGQYAPRGQSHRGGHNEHGHYNDGRNGPGGYQNGRY